MLLNRLILPLVLLTGVSFGQDYGSLSGAVTDKSGIAVSGATVYAVPIKPAGAFPKTKTDADGRYIFERLPYGGYTVLLAKPSEGYPDPFYVPKCNDTKEPEIELSEENPNVKLDLGFGEKAGVLVGTVADADSGKPIDANSELRCLSDPSRSVTMFGTLTYDTLTFAQFKVLVPSNTSVFMTVRQRGYEEWRFTQNGVAAPILLAPGETLILDIKLKRTAGAGDATP